MILQFLINGLISGSLYALLAMAFSLTYNTTRTFNFAYVGVIVIACYLNLFFYQQLGESYLLSVPLALIVAGLLNWAIEKWIYQPLERKDSSPTSIIVASIGVFIILINLIAMIWGNQNKTFSQGLLPTLTYHNIMLTGVQIRQFFTALICIILFLVFINKSSLGLKIKALSFDNLLYQVFGFNAKRLRMILYFVSGVLGATVSLLIGYDVGFDPYFGMNLFLNAVVVMILGGFGSYTGAVVGGLLLGVIQSMSVYFFQANWESVISFGILILILVFRPQGIFGVKQREV